MDKKTEKSRKKALADRLKFESVVKVEISPLITSVKTIGQNKPIPDLRSPDEKQTKWREDPEDLRKNRIVKKVDSLPTSGDKG